MTHAPVPPDAATSASADNLTPAATDAAEASLASGRDITGAVSVQLVARMLGMIASVVTLALTTRHLGVHDYGVLTTAIVFVGVWTSLTELGVGAVIVRRVSARTGDLSELVGVNIGLSIAYCVPLAVLTAGTGLAVYHDNADVHGVLLVVSVSLVPSALATCFNPVFMSTMRFATVAVADVTSRLASLAGTVLVVTADGGLVWYGVVQIVPPVVQLVILGARAGRITPLRPRFDRAATVSLLRESLPQTAVLVIGVLYWRADAVILTLLGTVGEVGVYGLAYTIAFTTAVLSTFYLSSSLSSLTSAFAHDRPAFARIVSSGIQVMLFAGLPIAVIGGVLARPLVALLADETYATEAAVPLTLLLVAVALTFLTGTLSQALFAAHEQGFLLRLNIVNLLLNIGLNVVFVPLWGAVGSATALVISEVPGLVIVAVRLSRRHGCSMPWMFLVHLMLPLAASAAVALALRDVEVVAAFVLAGFTYVAVNLALGPVRLSDARALVGRDTADVAT